MRFYFLALKKNNMKKVAQSILAMIVALYCALALPVMSGCSSEEFKDGYQFGDLTHLTEREITVLEKHRETYCNEYNSNIMRQAALAAIRTQVPLIPENGIC